MNAIKPALSGELKKQINKVKQASLIVGIPAYNCASTINYVIYQSALGLINFFPEFSSIIFIADGGSTDGTLNVAKAFKLPNKVNLILGRYKGISGKGSAVKAMMEACIHLNSNAIVIIDSDLRSIKPEWIKILFNSVIKKGGDLATPVYIRDKFDGTITNHLCYPFTKGVYEKDLRQPISGDFALSRRLVENLLQNPLWENSFTRRFGIDIFITHYAIANKYRIYEAFLGSKVHEPKDPAEHLKSMFIQVAGSILECMIEYRPVWEKISGNKTCKVPLLKENFSFLKPEPLLLNFKTQKLKFKEEAYKNRFILKKLLSKELLNSLLKLDLKDEKWAKIAYSLASSYIKRELDPLSVLKAFYSVWLAKVTFFIKEALNLTDEEAEAKVKGELKHLEN